MPDEVQTSPTDPTAAPDAAAPTPQQQSTATATGTPAGQGQATPAAPITFTDEKALQAEIDKRLKERLEREQRKSEDRERKAREEAERKTLEEQGNFKALAEKHAKRVAELEAAAAESEKATADLTAKLKRYEAALTAQREAQFKSVPDAIKPLLERMDLAEQLEWLAANAASLAPAAAPAPANINATRRSNGSAASIPEAERQELAAIYGVNPKYLPK